MNAPNVGPYLESVELKIGRARHHLSYLRSIISDIRKRKPYEISREFEADGRTEVFKFRENSPPPDVLPVVLGDFIFNCRSALDHLAFALHVARSGIPTPEEAKDIQFPLVLDRDKWGRIAKKQIGGIHPMAQTLIERAQPYYGPNPATHPFGLLYGLSNIDKHRTVHFAYYQFTSVLWFGDPSGRWVRSHLGVLEDGAEVAAFEWSGETQPDVDFVFACDLSLREGPAAEQRVALVVLRIMKELLAVRDSLVPYLLT